MYVNEKRETIKKDRENKESILDSEVHMVSLNFHLHKLQFCHLSVSTYLKMQERDRDQVSDDPINSKAQVKPALHSDKPAFVHEKRVHRRKE